MKSHGRMLWESANGRGDDSVVSVRVDAKGIGNSVTLPKDVVTREEAKEVLLHLAESVGARLREAGQKAGMLSVEIRYHTFENSSHQRQLFRATSNDSEIYHIAVELFDELWDKRPVRLLGIRSSKLQKEDEPEQLSIFDIQREQKDAARTEKQKRLDKALDEIRKKYGEDAVKRGRFL